MSTTRDPARLQSHVSIDTADLPRSTAFYRALFDREPALARPDYVRFWPDELGLVLGLNARRGTGRGGGALQHLGVLFPDVSGLGAARARLAAVGFPTDGAEDVTCCHARLDQFWATDPSGVRWELFVALEEVVAEPGVTAPAASACCAPGCCA